MIRESNERLAGVSSQQRLLGEMRQLGTDIMRMEQAMAEAVGLNTTDLHCLEILGRVGPLAASELAAESGLSRAAVTTVIDRLERGGWAKRSGDPADRRRVMVQLTAKAADTGQAMFRDLVRASMELHGTYSEQELQLLLRFVGRTRELLQAHARRVPSESDEEGGGVGGAGGG